ncbi:Phosphonopyruvate decarboxylase [Candidatus Burkholderia pumila]|uniref:Phosphonopyruvate decarboxylase n=1 Tax=Candidatus Burkholderia pumila TaxID=1090375 RepID=A0ABR5HPH5_9BURK|nr:Phosphonopyruvate decarboxylase [Candidatus Burkholderia pumila]
MIEASQFVEAARERGFDWYAGVPCSFLTPFINYVLQDESLHYVSAANEGDAVALIAGVALGGAGFGSVKRRGIAMMQNSGLGNAVSPLTSLTWPFRLPQLLIVTWRGQPGVHDEPQHALVGPITPQMLETMEIPWELFPTEADQIGPALDLATEYMDSTGRPYALVMQKGSVAPYELKKAGLSGVRTVSGDAVKVLRFEKGARVARHDALEKVIANTPKDSTVVLASTGFCGRELYAIDDRENQFYLVGSMGCVTPMALGLALSRPDLGVIALDGDGAALMRMGVFATLGAYGPPNFVHLLLDNGAHESTGGQATVSRGIDFTSIASACGYALALDGDDIGIIDRLFEARDVDGVRFARLSIDTGTPSDLPRPKITPEDVRARLQQHIGSR